MSDNRDDSSLGSAFRAAISNPPPKQNLNFLKSIEENFDRHTFRGVDKLFYILINNNVKELT